MQEKPPLRRELRRRRAALSARGRRRREAALARALHRHPVYRNARRIAVYRACGTELSLDKLLDRAAGERKQLAFPVLRGRRMHFATAVGGWRRNRHGIAEPAAPALRRPRFNLVLVPLLGFDDEGYRLGQGGGYYDRRFAGSLRPRLLGIAFDEQRVARVPRQPWDLRLDGVATPGGLSFFGNDGLRWDTGY